MKGEYQGIILFLLFLFAAALVTICFIRPGVRFYLVVQMFSALAIAVTAVIALSNSDPPKKKIKVKVRPYITRETENWEVKYPKKELTPELSEYYKDWPDPIESYKVQFEMTNESDFDLVDPVVTFRLPVENQAPDKKEKESTCYYDIRQYRSNTFNTRVDLKVLEMVDGIILSNKNLPYWRAGEHITFWIRIACWKEDPVPVTVSVDCTGRRGYGEKIEVDILELAEKARNSSNNSGQMPDNKTPPVPRRG
jgi:hypothetical protein